MKKGLSLIATLLLFSACMFNKPVSDCPDYRIFIRPDDTADSVLRSIIQSDPLAKTKALKFILDRRDYDSHIRTGCYTVKSGALPKQVADMLTAAKQVYSQSGGALDLTVYPLLKLWGFIDEKYYVPYDYEILDQLSRVCFDQVLLTSFPSSGTYTVSLPSYGEMSFGALAKGCASDKAIESMRAAGVTSGVISLGGNVQTLGLKPDGTMWTVGVADPNNPSSYVGVLNVGETAVVTSGSYQRFFPDITTGNIYHHILKPQSGYPVSNNLVSATIICKDGTMADALSTAMFVLGEVQSLNYWRQYGKTDGGGFDMVLITKDKRIICTKGLIEEFTLVNEEYTLSYSE